MFHKPYFIGEKTMTLIERFENERKSLVYHLESMQEKLLINSEDEFAIEQIKKIEMYIKALDGKINELKN